MVEAYEAQVDRGLLRVNLRRSPDERLGGLESIAEPEALLEERDDASGR